MTRRVIFILTAAIALRVCITAGAQGFDLSWNTIDGGGGTSASQEFALSGTAGQPDARSPALSGAAFELAGGFWPGAAAPGVACVPCDTNCDGSVNQFDIQGFVTELVTGNPGCSLCSADTNGDGSVNQFDIQGFVECLMQ